MSNEGVLLIRRWFLASLLALTVSIALWIEPVLTASGSPQPVQAPTLVPTPPPRSVPSPTPRPLPALNADSTVLAYPAPPIQARAAYLVDVDTGQVLFAQNADAELPMASTTKITTAALALQHGGLNDLVRISHAAATVGESTMALTEGERVTVRQLLYGLLLNSGNDAAVALAEHVGGTQAHFVAMMNALARTLHMTHTHYATPHGLDAPDHYTSAHDLATIAMYAMRDPTFRQIVDTESYYVHPTKHNGPHWLANINRVMYWYPGVDGVKPGDTDNAGLCQVVSVQRDGRSLLAVLLNTPTLVNDIRNLLNYGLRDFRWVQAPAYWDGPANSLFGGSGTSAWRYYFGAGHYIRGLFLAYFNSHGGLTSLGYPRTEQILQDGRTVQYFENAELAYDPTHRSVYPVDLGNQAAGQLHLRHLHAGIDSRVAWLYRLAGGSGVLGMPISGMVWTGRAWAQLYQYGEIALTRNGASIVPLGDAALIAKGWLPGWVQADAIPSDMSESLVGKER